MSENLTESRYLTIDNGRGLQGTFSSIGAGIYSLTLDNKPLILSPSDKNVFLNSEQCFGKTLGRVAGRISNKLNINYHEYDLVENEPGICLHGGLKESLTFKDFDSIIVTRSDKTYVMFNYTSPNLEAGFPANVKITITYTLLHDEDGLRIDFIAQSDDDTILSLSNHMYFNFFNSIDVNNYSLMINASKYGASKNGTKLIDHFKAVPDFLDFREPSLIKEKLGSGNKAKPMDDVFLFDKTSISQPQIVLENDSLKLECFTDYEACNIYLDDTMSDIEFTNGINKKKRRAIAIEPQCSPLSPFILKPGSIYHYHAIYRFTRK